MIETDYRGWHILMEFDRDEQAGKDRCWPRVRSPDGVEERIGDAPLAGPRPALTLQAFAQARRWIDRQFMAELGRGR